ncbi:hypothetical protein CTAYLR_009416 [Chrysophaeum taylorii]|uniref:cGMP-dependent protein kinase n=1 Tax=Chrysophaeum taylorii TaxID=2483200 RepID=A0AAD7UJF0_9STRA|nr:hypothetical protein CTAYLR_009416 [Chrysophaeum taylorii]
MVSRLLRRPIVNNPKTFEEGEEEPPALRVSETVKSVLMSALHSHYVFSGLSPSELLKMIVRMRRSSAVEGERIITQGEAGDRFYCLYSGSAFIEVDGHQVGEYRALESFGELALLYSAPRAATIVALEACVLYSVDMQTFHQMSMRAHKSAARATVSFLRHVPLLAGFEEGLLHRVSDALVRVEYEKDQIIMREGEAGEDFFLIEAGEVRCTTHARQALTLSRGDYFGEMALVLDEPRHATVTCATKLSCFKLNRHDFVRLFGPMQAVLEQQMRIRILKSVPLLRHLPSKTLEKLAEAMKIQLFRGGRSVIKEGEPGSRFYIINEGRAKVVRNLFDGLELVGEEELRILHPQDYFGERSLIADEPRNATVVALEPLECLVLDRQSFRAYLKASMSGKNNRKNTPHPEPRDLRRVAALGSGTFGRVSLVVTPERQVYALKQMQKKQILECHQERNIMNEKNLLAACSQHPMVLELVATYQDRDCVYMLLELVQGGELWSLIYEKKAETRELRRGGCGCFATRAASFYAACVAEALSYVHGRGIAYRDLKPENLMIDAKGYVKVIDFGFAKVVPWDDAKGRHHAKTYTVCGTPEYLSPELVQSRGHDRAVDLWAFGCLIFELLAGRTPFADSSQPEIYRKILSAKKILDSKSRLWPKGFASDAKDLVQKLAKTEPIYRLGADDAKDHPWFASLDFKALYKADLEAPYVPRIKDALDTSNFLPCEEDDDDDDDNNNNGKKVARYTGKQDVFAAWSRGGGGDFRPPAC